jgi:arylsulfatase A-like enzyme
VSTSHSLLQEIPLTLAHRRGEIVVRSDHPFQVRKFILRRRGMARSYLKPKKQPEDRPQGPVTEHRVAVDSPFGRRLRLYLWLNDVVQDPDMRWQRYGREVAWADRNVGELLARLRERGLYDDALIVFTADHGEALGCHNHIGHVEYLYDCFMRVPLIVKLPGNHSAGSRRDDLASLLDLFPTIAARLGLRAPDRARGRDLFAPDATGVEPILFMETHPPHATRVRWGLRGPSTKIIWTPADDRWELFNLSEDPEEAHDLARTASEKLERWQRRLADSLHSLPPPPSGSSPPLDDETREQLRALGYVTD